MKTDRVTNDLKRKLPWFAVAALVLIAAGGGFTSIYWAVNPFANETLFEGDTGASTVTTNTQIKGLSGSGLSYYVTDWFVSNGGTAQTISIVSSTTAGNACATSPTTVVPPISAGVNGGAAPDLQRPIKVTANSALCCTISGSTAFSCQVEGFVAP